MNLAHNNLNNLPPDEPEYLIDTVLNGIVNTNGWDDKMNYMWMCVCKWTDNSCGKLLHNLKKFEKKKKWKEEERKLWKKNKIVLVDKYINKYFEYNYLTLYKYKLDLEPCWRDKTMRNS